MITSELSAFWDSQNYKIYVVALHCKRKKNNRGNEIKYVTIRKDACTDTADTRHRAALVAFRNSYTFKNPLNVDYSVRLADPVADLSCEEVASNG